MDSDLDECNRLRLEAYADVADAYSQMNRLENLLEQTLRERDILKEELTRYKKINTLLKANMDKLKTSKANDKESAACTIQSLRQKNYQAKEQLNHAVRELAIKRPFMTQEEWLEHFSGISNIEE